jgi:Kdo2-lipid IVA lauroyltransferase/acyltransferase
MQDKMATRNRALNALYSASFWLWFPFLFAMARVLPRRVLYAVARATIGTYFRFRPKYLHAICANYAQILSRPADSSEVIATARAMVDNHSYYWIDFFYSVARPRSETLSMVEEVRGYGHILEGLDRGRGVLLLTAHIGNWEIGGVLLGGARHQIHVVYKPDRFPIVERWRQRLHRWGNVGEIPVGASFLATVPVLRALQANAIVAMQADRDFNNTGIAIPFFGREAYFPRGPMTVAMATGATVLPAFILRGSRNRYRVDIGEPIPVELGAGHEELVRRNMERFVRILESRVALDPSQWLCFYPFWDDPTRAKREGETG